MQLKGQRCGKLVCLRDMDEKDASPYIKWLKDPEVANIVGIKQIPSLKERAQQLKNLAKSPNDLVLGIELRDKSELIGTIGLRDIDTTKNTAEAAIFIGDKHEWDKGYGTEAMKLLLKIGFEKLNLKRIQLHVDSANLRARHVFTKLGFKEESKSERLIVMVKEA